MSSDKPIAPQPPPLPPPVAPPPPPVPRQEVPAIMTNLTARYLFSLSELAEMFGLSQAGAKKVIKDVEPDGKRGRAFVWQLSRVAKLTGDVELAIQREYESRNDATLGDIQTANKELPITDLGAMTPAQLKVYFQTVDIQQSYLGKRRINLQKAGELIPKESVREAFVNVFKIITIFFDTLPDVLERDGIVDRGRVDDTIKVVDGVRQDMADKVQDYVDNVGNIDDV